MNLNNLKRKVDNYKVVQENTVFYRQQWQETYKELIKTKLVQIAEEIGIDADVEEKTGLVNLEAIVMSLGDVRSGIFQKLKNDVERHMIKNKGALIYQQLFNGKIIVMLQMPYIQEYMEQQPPRTIGIYRPEELNDGAFTRHVDNLITEITKWEDYDDDEPNGNKIGFNMRYPDALEEEA